MGTTVLLLLACGSDQAPGPPRSDIGKKTFASYSWSPKVCPTSGLNLKDVEISSDFFQARHLSYPEVYANYIHRPWRMLFNQNIKYVGLQFNKFLVQQNDNTDYLMVTHAFGTQTYYGFAGEAHAPVLNQVMGPWQVMGGYNTTGYLEFKFWSDAVMTHAGYRINKLNLLCYSSTTSPYPLNNTWITRNYPHDGYLMGTDDVIYAWTKQPPGYEMALVLYPYDSCTSPPCPGSSEVDDFDVFASTNTPLPSSDPTKHQWSGTLGYGYGETVIIPSFTGTAERTIYIAIGSWSGAGQFRFYANIHAKPINDYSRQEGTARTNFNPTSDEKTQIKDLLRSESRAVYFGTDGRHLIKHWTIHWKSHDNFWPYPTQIFTKEHTGHSYCSGDGDFGFPCGTGGATHVLWNTGAWCECSPQPCTCVNDPLEIERQGVQTGAHELGHCIYGFMNEYESTGNCGHSMMQKGHTPEKSPYFTNITDFCVWRNGGKDPEPQTASTHSQQDNNWDCLKQRLDNYIAFPTNWTPDPFYRTQALAPYLNDDHHLLENKITFTEVP